MDAEEGALVAVGELDGGVGGGHVGGHQRRVGAGLDDEVLELDALQQPEILKFSLFSWLITKLE